MVNPQPAPRERSWPFDDRTSGFLMALYSDLMAFYSDLMGFYSDLMGCTLW